MTAWQEVLQEIWSSLGVNDGDIIEIFLDGEIKKAQYTIEDGEVILTIIPDKLN
jgi:hypothetical protein